MTNRDPAGELDIGRKIAVLSFLAMVGVVYIHHNAIGTAEPAHWSRVAQTFFTRALTDWAVPFFFVMSGFRFARGRYVQKTEDEPSFYIKKMRTLLIPYLLWAVIGAIVCLPVILFNNHLKHSPLFARTCYGAEGIWEGVDRLFGVTRNGPTGNLALWYVRTLLVFFIAAPVWKALFRLSHWIPLTIGLPLAFLAPEDWIPGTGLKAGSLGWLLCGMGLSGWLAENRKLSRRAAVFCGVAWGILSFAKAWGGADCSQLIPVVTIACLWSVSDWGFLYRRWMRPTFWVYCLHGALAAYSLNGPLFLFGKGDVATLLIMLTMPWMNIAVCLLLAGVVRRKFHFGYEVLTGGRA